MQTSFSTINSIMCDEKIDCSYFGSRPGIGRPKSRTKKCLFREKKAVDRTTLAIRTTGRPYRTSARILPENNF